PCLRRDWPAKAGNCTGQALNSNCTGQACRALQEYDYSQASAYFITICTQNRKCLFGDIVDTGMALNDAGKNDSHRLR
ncbi:TPA: hypothetical protein DD712_02240, partial [Candidatus Acetothermia bacterium]|nr:hypothetical protein [Candidatus Acetothermia bacterium]